VSNGRRALTPRQSRFVEEYLVDLNATQAAIRAGYSERTANQTGPRLLLNVGIAAAVRAAKAKRSEETGITAAQSVHETWDLYQECRADRDRATAARLLDMMMKHTGAYETDNRQRQPGSPVTIIRLPADADPDLCTPTGGAS